jgi:CRISPR-associated protein Cas1
MKHLLNTLYVTSPGAFLCREGETVIVRVEQETKLQVPVAAARQLFPTLAGMNEY